MRITKNRDESDTGSIASPGYASTGHFAYNWPEVLSSKYKIHRESFSTKRIRPHQSGTFKFQSAALYYEIKFISSISLYQSFLMPIYDNLSDIIAIVFLLRLNLTDSSFIITKFGTTKRS